MNLADPVRVLDLRVSLVRLRASAEASSAALPLQGTVLCLAELRTRSNRQVDLVALKYCSSLSEVGAGGCGGAYLHRVGFA